MMTTYLINELLLRVVGAAANALLRLLGGPDNLPNTNDDFVWY